jgi:exonuclease VII large subunit
MEALSPLAVLSRGYAMVSDEARERTLTHAGKLCVGERVRLRFSDGEALAQIREIALNKSASDHVKKENG